MSGAQTRLDGTTLVVRIPMRFQRRGGRKRIVAPDGSAIAPSSKPQPDGTLVKALARAWRWQRMLDEGVYTTVSEIGDAENISKSYVSRILRLALLAPDIVEAILVRADGSGAHAGAAGAAAAGRAGRSSASGSAEGGLRASALERALASYAARWPPSLLSASARANVATASRCLGFGMFRKFRARSRSIRRLGGGTKPPPICNPS